MLIIVTILIVLGSLSAWRASPLYSLKSTFKLAGAFLLIVAVVVSASMAIFSGPLSHSPIAQAILGLAAFLVISIGASVTLVRITDRHVAQLPPSVQLVTIHRQRIYRWIWRLVVYLLINAAAALVIPSFWKWLPMFLGGFVLMVCGPMLGLALMMARRNDRGVTAIVASPWVHWQYKPEQWKSWAKNQLEWERTKESPWSWRKMLIFILFCGGLFGLGLLFNGGITQENLIIFCGLLGFIVLLVLILYWMNCTHFDRRNRRLLAAPPEAYFGDEGLFCNGEYMQWILSGRYLLAATLASGPPACVVLVFESFNGSTSIKVTKRILIPEDRAPDLPLLQQKLEMSCPTARVRLVAHERA
jgi:hypothetical protein